MSLKKGQCYSVGSGVYQCVSPAPRSATCDCKPLPEHMHGAAGECVYVYVPAYLCHVRAVVCTCACVLCASMCLCMHANVHACVYGCLCAATCVMCLHTCVCMPLCVRVCIYMCALFMCECVPVCMCVNACVRMYLCMHACECVYWGELDAPPSLVYTYTLCPQTLRCHLCSQVHLSVCLGQMFTHGL